MKIHAIAISNFRGIRHATLSDLGSTVVIAGANGSGKSCIFDAIRLLKSIYGGYQQNEWHHWMGEFQITFQNSVSSLSGILNDKSKPLQLTCTFRLHPDEREYLRTNGKQLVRESVWRVIAPEVYGWSSFRAVPLAAQLRTREPEVEAQTETQFQLLLHELSAETLTAQFQITDVLTVTPSKALELVFSSYVPTELGVIDYHGPQRFFSRETVQGINLNLDAIEQQKKQHALYNYSNKYTNVKTEMAAAYVKEMIAARSDPSLGKANEPLSHTLKELFKSFFPDKTFLGPQPRPDGTLAFPVQTADGNIHDLDELSAGEKEILFGYLRIRNSAPRYSVILIDEPELHLNPRLVRGLPQFYHKHLGVALDNQIWLITHSDALLREVVGNNDFNLFHMQPPFSTSVGQSQAKALVADEDIERAVINLVGDLAAYRPGGKVVVFEGGGDSDFDMQMTGMLFPQFQSVANFLAGGNKARVQHLHEILQKAADKGKLPFKIFSVTDRDSSGVPPATAGSYQWNVYHIENYLLESSIILPVLHSLGSKALTTEVQVYEALRESARETLPHLVRFALNARVNETLVRCINTSTNPDSSDVAVDLRTAAERSAKKVETALSTTLALSKLQSDEDELRTKYEYELSGDEWRSNFRGRDILKRFAGTYAQSVSYEIFRNLIISRMTDSGFKPIGMNAVVEDISRA